MAKLSAQQDMKDFSDALLAQEIQQGNQAAFEEITKRYQGLIASIAARYSATGFDRADFMQEGLLALHSACKSFSDKKGGASFRNFAALCISRRFMSVIRSANTKGAIPEDSLVSFDGIELSDNNSHNPETLILQQESSEDFMKAIRNALSPLESDVLNLYLCGMSYTEIAKKLSTSPKSVDNALQRIRKKISSVE